MSTTASPARPVGCACKRVHMAVLADYVRLMGRYPERYEGIIHHRCGLGDLPAPVPAEYRAR